MSTAPQPESWNCSLSIRASVSSVVATTACCSFLRSPSVRSRGAGGVPLALGELHDAAVFYSESANVEHGLAFVAEFERAVDVILVNPTLGAVFRRTRRRVLLRRLPYGVIISLPQRNFGSLPWHITGGAPAIGLVANRLSF